MAVYLGNPNVHSLGAMTHGLPLIRALRTRNRYSATSVDQLPHHLAATTMFGHMLLLPIPDIDRTRFFLALGANPLASNGSLMTAPGMPLRLKALKARGGRLVVVDPRRTETAELADTHLFIRPGTDALLLAALVRTILEERLERPGRLAEFTDGLDEVRTAVAPFAPERVAGPTGIAAEQIRTLARDFARADVGRGLRARRRLHPGVRRRGPVAHPGAQRHHRQPRPARRSALHPAGGEPARAHPARRLRAPPHPRPEAARRSAASSRWPRWPRRSSPTARDGSARW